MVDDIRVCLADKATKGVKLTIKVNNQKKVRLNLHIDLGRYRLYLPRKKTQCDEYPDFRKWRKGTLYGLEDAPEPPL